MIQYDSVVVLGPTACGKTTLGVQLARILGGEVLSADCRQVYRGLDIGSGKDLDEFVLSENGFVYRVPYHLIDIVDLNTEYNLFQFQKDFYRVFADVVSRGKLPIIVGGTGMYLDAVIRGYDMDEVPIDEELRAELATLSMEKLVERFHSLKRGLHNTTDILERTRLVRAIEIAEYKRRRLSVSLSAENKTNAARAVHPVILGITFPRSELRNRIAARLKVRMKQGLIAEVQHLHEHGAAWERLERLGLEYRFIAEYLQGKISSEDELFFLLNRAIGQFAKRQETWFRGMERKGVTIIWLCPHTEQSLREQSLAVLDRLAPELLLKKD